MNVTSSASASASDIVVDDIIIIARVDKEHSDKIKQTEESKGIASMYDSTTLINIIIFNQSRKKNLKTEKQIQFHQNSTDRFKNSKNKNENHLYFFL
jgi:isocitrate lyase